MLLKFAIKDFLDDRAFRNVSAKSLANYEGTLNEFHAYCVAAGVVNVSDVRPATVKGYLLSCQRDKGNKPSSINHKLQNLRVFFNYLEQEGIRRRPSRRGISWRPFSSFLGRLHGAGCFWSGVSA